MAATATAGPHPGATGHTPAPSAGPHPAAIGDVLAPTADPHYATTGLIPAPTHAPRYQTDIPAIAEAIGPGPALGLLHAGVGTGDQQVS